MSESGEYFKKNMNFAVFSDFLRFINGVTKTAVSTWLLLRETAAGSLCFDNKISEFDHFLRHFLTTFRDFHEI